MGSGKQAEKLVEEVRKLVSELEGAFRDVQQVKSQCAESEQAAAIVARRAQLLFQLAPSAGVVIEADGTVVDANQAASQLLNVSHRHLVGKPFHLFVGVDRELFLTRLQQLSATEEAERWPAILRPRERRVVRASIVAALDASDRILLMLLPETAQSLPEVSVLSQVSAAS